MINVTINGMECTVPEGASVVEAAKISGIKIPTLCYLKGINEIASCRVCLIEVEGARTLLPACATKVREGMVIKTNTKKVLDSRKAMVELILSDHNKKCLTCSRNTSCELQALANDLCIEEVPYKNVLPEFEIDDSSPSLVRDNSKCILCRRCVSACRNLQETEAINIENRGYESQVKCSFGHKLGDSNCINCGQCIVACPVGALRERNSMDDVWAAINDPSKHVVIQAAPAVRAAFGEEFGVKMGTPVTNKMISAMRALGVDRVFDTNFAADLTIMEEGTELIDRVSNGGVLPMITSCSPGWIKYCEHHYPDLLPNLSSCKSPHEMFGAVIKTYYAQKNNIDPKSIYVVSVMPCTAKKYERQRDELKNKDGLYDVDAVITTRELAKMVKTLGLDFNALPEGYYDDMLGEHTGAAVLFGATGGVMEAALRTVVEVLTGEEAKSVDYCDVRGVEGVKEATYKIGDLEVKVAVAHGMGTVKPLLDDIKAGKSPYHFIEIMGCPGGCVTGGGQPFVKPYDRLDCDIRVERAKALYTEDSNMAVRKSHKNQQITKLYDEFLEKPNSHIAHELLHTHYVARNEHTK